MQQYLQLCEANFEPDGVEVAAAFAEMAEAYMHAGRYRYLSSNRLPPKQNFQLFFLNSIPFFEKYFIY